MDTLYRPEKFSCTEHKNLKEYFLAFSTLHSLQNDPIVGLSPESVKKQFIQRTRENENMELENCIESQTSIHLLTATPEELDCKPKLAQLANRKDLRTPQIRKADKSLLPLKKRVPNIELYANNEDSCNNIVGDMIPGEEFCVSIRIYHPFEFSFDNEKPNSYHNIKFSHEIIVLGSNTLAELRDKILCFNDMGIFSEVKDPFEQIPPNTDAKQEYPSGFIFIDNTFYNDFRHPKSIDYSETIIEWAKRKRIQPFNVAQMDLTRIEDLSPRFGYPYVYLHQGKCEHIIVFTDAWLMISNNGLTKGDYPRHQGVHRFITKLCIICNTQTAQWMVIDSDRLPHVRSFLCSQCMFSYLYKDRKKVGDFKVYQFYDKNFIL